MITLTEQDVWDYTPPTESLYLSADAPSTFTHLDPATTYIIGGLVDHNRFKNMTLEHAAQHGIPTAQLPLLGIPREQGGIELKGRKVMTVVCVFDMLSTYLKTGDWKEAMLQVLPKRLLPEEE